MTAGYWKFKSPVYSLFTFRFWEEETSTQVWKETQTMKLNQIRNHMPFLSEAAKPNQCLCLSALMTYSSIHTPTLFTQLIYSHLSNLQIIIGEWKGVYKLKCTSKSAVMKYYQSIPCAVLFAYKWHNIITLSGLPGKSKYFCLLCLVAVTQGNEMLIEERKASLCDDWHSIMFGGSDEVVALEMFENNILQSRNSQAVWAAIWITVRGLCWMTLPWTESVRYDLRVIGCPQWSIDKQRRRAWCTENNSNKKKHRQ